MIAEDLGADSALFLCFKPSRSDRRPIRQAGLRHVYDALSRVAFGRNPRIFVVSGGVGADV